MSYTPVTEAELVVLPKCEICGKYTTRPDYHNKEHQDDATNAS